MRFILSLIHFSPILLQFVLAAGLGYVGFAERQDAAAEKAKAQELLAAAPPSTVPIADFVAMAPEGKIQEVSVLAQFVADSDMRLVPTKTGTEADPSLMVILTDQGAAADKTVARAAIVFPPEQKDTVVDWLASNSTSRGEAGPVVAISGLVVGSAKALQADDALEDQGMTRAPGFFLVEPFLYGREAGYQARIAAIERQDGKVFFFLAGVLVLVGMANLAYRTVKGTAETEDDEPTLTSKASDRFALVAQLAAEDPSPEDATAVRRGPSQADYLTVPTDFTKGTFDHVSWSRKTSSDMSMPRLLAILVIVGLVGLQLSGGTKQLPDIFAHPERLFVGLRDKEPVAAVPDTREAEAAPPVAEEPLASSAQSGAADATAPAPERPVWTGREEPPVSAVAWFLFTSLFLFVVILRWKANRLLRARSRARPAAKIYIGDRSFRV